MSVRYGPPWSFFSSYEPPGPDLLGLQLACSQVVISLHITHLNVFEVELGFIEGLVRASQPF